MVDFRDPVIELKDYAALKSFYHITCGMYLWEYFTTLDYEFEVVRGHRPYRWTIWIYSLSRAATLMAVILNIIDLNTTTAINCQVWVTFEVIFGYLGLVAASLLIVARIIAIWNKNKIAMAIAASLWVVNAAAIIQGIVRLRADWSSALPGCIIFNSDRNEINMIVTLITDILLLLIVLIGLLRLRSDGLGTFGIARLLWKQGVIWFLLATIADVPPTVLIILNLNDPLNVMFQLPAVIIMSIAATRMHRSLTDFVSGTTDITSGDLQNGNNKVSKLWKNQTRCSQIEVTVDSSYEECRTSRTGHHDPYNAMEGQPGEKLQILDFETGPENPVASQVPR